MFDTNETVATIGDNSGDTKAFAVDRLRNIVERIERLNDERTALGSDIRDIYVEAKSAGFDLKVLRQLIALRRKLEKDAAGVVAQEAELDTYKHALGM